MKKILLLYIGFFASIILSSCDSYSDIKIITPVDGQEININQSVQVKAKLFDSDGIEGEKLIVISEQGDTIFQHHDDAFHGKSHTLLKSFEATTQGNCKIEVSVYGGSGWSSKSVMINVN